ncbi:hypothetical protein ANO14919_086040 [Xylariales sp. No.14919]|nr:hypothetical protein ANO14919_086040 [Xylariales sp. No.14919]
MFGINLTTEKICVYIIPIRDLDPIYDNLYTEMAIKKKLVAMMGWGVHDLMMRIWNSDEWFLTHPNEPPILLMIMVVDTGWYKMAHTPGLMIDDTIMDQH